MCVAKEDDLIVDDESGAVNVDRPGDELADRIDDVRHEGVRGAMSTRCWLPCHVEEQMLNMWRYK